MEYEKLMDRVFYLGPLRDYPRRRYNWSGSSPYDVGARGESTINAILAASERGKAYQMKKKSRKRSFQEVVAMRLKEMGLIHSFSVAEIAKGSNIYQAKVAVDKESPEVLLTDVGFGVSQVLPVIVLLNYVPKNSIVIFEQPEIHLHPEGQSGLADAIIQIAETRDLQVISREPQRTPAATAPAARGGRNHTGGLSEALLRIARERRSPPDGHRIE